MKSGYKLNNRYRILRPLGEGGMANVYLAYDQVLERKVSVKLLRMDLRDDPKTQRRFEREAMAATQLNDPHIVGVYDVGTDHGMQYMVMQYVEGTDLKAFIKQNYPIPLPQVVDIMEQVLAAVETAHRHGIIHRDLKPQNILIDEDKNIKITDFGIAMASTANSLTQTNTLVGSVHYLSPEQARGSIATERSDIYSLGIILFELLTGHVPFEGETAVSIALKHFRDEMPSVRDINPAIPQPLANVVYKATAKSPQQRYESAAAMAADLKTALNPGREAEPRFQEHDACDDQTRVLDLAELKAADHQAQQQLAQDDFEEDTKQLAPLPTKAHSNWLRGLLVALAVVIVMALGGLWYFNRPIAVPSVAGKTPVQASRVLAHHHLKIGTITRENSATVAKGKVIKPASAAKVRYGRAVNLVVSDGVAHWKMKDLVGTDVDQAQQQLENLGFTVKIQKKHSDEIAEGQIIKQNVTAGKTIQPTKQVVTLTVSAGRKQIKIPNFKNKDIKDVQAFANEHGLQLTETKKKSTTVATNRVLAQTPKAGSTLAQGDTLTVTVATSGDQLKTTNIQISIPFDSNNGRKENRVQVYISDAYHNLTMEYEDITINQETVIYVPFTLRDNQMGAYKVIRNGRTIMSATNITG